MRNSSSFIAPRTAKILGKPFTPVRKLFVNLKLDIFKPGSMLGKRRAREEEVDLGEREPPLRTKPPVATHADFRPGIPYPVRSSLEQQASPSTSTSSSQYAFSCRRDLAEMSREDLITAALAVNKQLPTALQIDVSHEANLLMDALEIIALGLGTHEVPGAPKAVKDSDAMFRFNAQTNLAGSPPSSPLAQRCRKAEPSDRRHPRLKVVQEGDEEFAGVIAERPVKKRRIRQTPGDSDSRCQPTRHDDINITTPTPTSRILRPRPLHASSTGLTKHAPNIDDDVKHAQTDLSLRNANRPKYRYRESKKDDAKRQPNTLGGSFPTRASGIRPRAVKSSQQLSLHVSSDPPSIASICASPSFSQSYQGGKRKRSDDDADQDMIRGLGGMHMGGSTSDMVVCA